uniref:Serine aminopeptidase S33 domain-containing protein n=1 Tax=Chromera velia CCMP2878 TaxID=1169474 RepID=A0A0G4FB27_9ALVE|mmetsp:Transcript_26888/g.52802  ORF Transcript_26888/g.52802 Transcript_26888/m.52802 type:complete len:478 (-) Transcript_26888:324-1757(-)|eukprot:Cvel_16084.t1-p1 / transcript=Cvel_16084.t1 / gene=Cvel_16084 / organism=Chromera_velia_CCMP2878 / gene_product=hypothetical protein / transcript_product=hypothetical protein / location=Cvel_scaffold1223:1248-7228(+) / protein_length=477 / sequence_SO=supercontig / SO=protein_coding / is_pseudo=false
MEAQVPAPAKRRNFLFRFLQTLVKIPPRLVYSLVVETLLPLKHDPVLLHAFIGVLVILLHAHMKRVRKCKKPRRALYPTNIHANFMLSSTGDLWLRRWEWLASPSPSSASPSPSVPSPQSGLGKGKKKEKDLVFLFHDFGEHSLRHEHWIKELCGRGYDVYALDMRGHGLSDSEAGERALWGSCEAVVEDLVLHVQTVLASRLRQEDANELAPAEQKDEFENAAGDGDCPLSVFLPRFFFVSFGVSSALSVLVASRLRSLKGQKVALPFTDAASTAVQGSAFPSASLTAVPSAVVMFGPRFVGGQAVELPATPMGRGKSKAGALLSLGNSVKSLGVSLVDSIGSLASRFLPEFPAGHLKTKDRSFLLQVEEQLQRDPLVLHGAVPLRSLVELRRAAVRAVRIAKDMPLPLLVVHGERDRIASLQGAAAFAAQWGAALQTLWVIPNEKHEVLQSACWRERVRELDSWMQKVKDRGDAM